MSGYIHRVCNGEHCKCKVAHTIEHEHLPEGGLDWNKRVWVCYNCGKRTPIRQYKLTTNEQGLTKEQEKTIEILRHKLIRAYATSVDNLDKYEYKTFEVTNTDGFVTLLAVVGRKNDEGTYGEFYGRDRRLISIGPGGAVKLLNAKKMSEAKGLHNVLYAQRAY